MWGLTANTDDNLLDMHLQLSNLLGHLEWSRVNVWNGAISVHEWKIGDMSFAFDVQYTAEKFFLSLVSRDKSLSNRLLKGLEQEGVKFSQKQGSSGKIRIGTYAKTDQTSSSISKNVCRRIIEVRNSVNLTIHETLNFYDSITGNTVNYSVKGERKSCGEVIFLFTSIRSKGHWIDFDGPFGKSLKSVRARIVFISDDAADEYTYNFASNGDTSIFQANINFIKNYVTSNGYTWEKVTLAGMSKGGTSAILLGSHLPSCTILALAPQLTLGNYLTSSSRFKIIRQISGLGGHEGAMMVDRIMWDILDNQQTSWKNKHLYILTSANDRDCISGLSRLRSAIRAKEEPDFSLYVDRTENTPTHLKTVHHLMPLFLSMFGIFSSGIRPKF